MHRKIKEDQVVDALELGGPLDPGLIPLQIEIKRSDPPDHSGRHGLSKIGEVRGPTTVLIHRELHPLLLGEPDEFLAVSEIEHEGLLTEDMLSRLDRFPNNGKTIQGVRGHIDHLDVITLEDGVVIIVNLCLGIKLVALGLGLAPGPTGNGGHLVATGQIGLEVKLADPTRADERDLGLIVLRPRRLVVDGGRIDLDDLLAGAQAVIVFFGHRKSIRVGRREAQSVQVLKTALGTSNVVVTASPAGRPAA